MEAVLPPSGITDRAEKAKSQPELMSGEEYHVFVNTMTGKTLTVDVTCETTVEELKRKVQDKEGIPPDQQRLICAGRQMGSHAEETLGELGAGNETSIHLVLRLMLLPSSGRLGFDLLPPPPMAECPSKEQMKWMLQRENELRLSSEIQEKLEWAVEGISQESVNAILEAVQKQVVSEAGYSQSEEQHGIQLLRSAQAIFPEDKEIHDIPMYVKYNRAAQGSVCVGDEIPSTQVASISGGRCLPFTEMITHLAFPLSQPIVVFTGSGS
jgi:hypothetical protein